MVEAGRTRAPEIAARSLVTLFVAAALGVVYYLAGGAIPYSVHWDGPTGLAFQGQYVAAAEGVNVTGGEPFASTYPHTVTFWGSRQLEVAASAQNSAGTDVLTTLTVRRAGVLCRNAYRWGTTADVVCNASGSAP